MDNNLLIQLFVGAIIGLGAGYLGSFMVLKRMSLVGDALSHVALPGIALGLLFHINPFIGAFTALFIAIVGIWALEKQTELPSETLVGIFFTTALAVGLLLTPEPDLLEALFGNISQISIYDAAITAAAIIVMFILMIKIKRGLILSTISKELTQSMGIPVNRINFIFLFLVSVVVALGLKVAGTILTGSLVIIPAAAARNSTVSMARYNMMSSLFGVIASVGGILFAHQFGLNPGPIIILAGGIIFIVTLLFKRQ